MKKFSFFLICSFLCSFFSFAQNGEGPIEFKPVYFDVSPPLRDMVATFKPTDNSWKEGYVKNHFDVANPTNNELKNTDPGIQNFYGQVLTDTTIQNFEGISNINGVIPPDTYGEVGPNHYFQVVNLSYAIYNKSGVKIFGPVSNASVWSGLPNNSNDGDAIVLYDEAANRWVFSQFSLPNYPSGPFYVMVAVSQTPDPTGSWYRYQYQFTNMPDYPKLGVWVDGYYMSGHAFNSSGNYVGLYAACFNRSLMLTGAPSASMVMFTKSSSSPGFGYMPTDCDGTLPPMGTPCYYVYRAPATTLGMYEFHVDWTTPSNSTFNLTTSLTVNTFGLNLNQQVIPQPGTTVKLDAIMDRMMFRVQFRQFPGYASIVCNHTVNASGIAGIRWYELRKTTGGWSVYQQSTYSPDTKYRWMGSICQDTVGNIALGFSISSSTLYPSIHYTGRMASDPLNTMTIAEKSIIEGTGSQTGVFQGRSRWGDYSGMSVDPDQTFWYTQEYIPVTSSMGWHSRVASFNFGNAFLISSYADPDLICLGDSSQLHVTASGGSGTYTYSWTSIPAGFTSNLQNPWAKPIVNTKYIVEVNEGSQTRTDTTQVTMSYEPTFTAGNDSLWCFPVTQCQLNGSVYFYKHIIWSTDGDGHFNNDTIAKPIYILGSNDLNKKQIHCTMTVYPANFPYGPCEEVVTDQVKITLDWCNAIEEQKENVFSLSVVPNPTHEFVTFTVSGINNTSVTLTVSDLQGKVLFNDNISGSTVTRKIDVSSYPKGIYFVRAKSSGNVKIEKLVIQ